MKRLWIAALLALGVAVGVPASQAHTNGAGGPVAIAAKSCGAGYTRASIGGAVKCLRRGEFCASRYASQYRRYGYSCYGGRLH
ncbi:MAG: hypothetical protein JWM71_1500 [Solirubrobacteraceae bacterium]|nr:hypothetical protein [Solirubrobacteraceae bacterium]